MDDFAELYPKVSASIQELKNAVLALPDKFEDGKTYLDYSPIYNSVCDHLFQIHDEIRSYPREVQNRMIRRLDATEKLFYTKRNRIEEEWSQRLNG